MKTTAKLKYIILTALFAAYSCDSYLKDDSGDLLIPKRVDEYQPLLYGEGYPRSFDRDAGWLVLMTDDVQFTYIATPESSPGIDNSVGEGKKAYTWDIDIDESLTDGFWPSRYSNIMCCNLIIGNADKIEYTTAETGKYYYLLAQAHALRAYNYFCLVNTYAAPYSAENLDKLGVVIRESAGIVQNEMSKERATIREVYKFINDDITKAYEYMELATPSTNKHLIRPISLKFLENRIALFQERWDDVITGGEEFLKMNRTVFDLTKVDESTLGLTSGNDFTMLDPNVNGEIIFTFGSDFSSYQFLANTNLFEWGMATSHSGYDGVENDDADGQRSLISMYGENDRRLKAYFAAAPTRHFYPIKYKVGTTVKGYHETWRTVEVILNLAEAYARKDAGVSEEAVRLLNELRSKRITPYTEISAGELTRQSLLRKIWAERRRELCFEEAMRFWDLRRQGMPGISHIWYQSQTVFETYVLPQGSPNYIMSIPRSEESYNGAITNNTRELILPR